MLSLIRNGVATALLLHASSSGLQESPLCAHVEIHVSQRLMVTRAAFEATLVVGNETADMLENFLVEVEIDDLVGKPASHLFAGLDVPALSGIEDGGIDGTGKISGNTTASVRWLLVPSEDAAPGAEPVKYTVSGRVRHKQHGVEVEIPLYPAEIEVFPDAKLFLDYYLQRNVYSDHPFTDEVEPAEPFALGLLVRNTGFGAARNLRITSSQPEITDNDRQLLIAFQILGAQLGNAPIDPSLAVNFGDLPASSSAVARWLMSSTLQGRFTCIDVDFQHVTNFGSDAISLIKDADIYYQAHTVELASPALPANLAYLDDGLPDFLVELDPLQTPPDGGDEPACGGSSLGADEDPSEVHSSEGSRLTIARDASAVTPRAPSPADLSVPLTVTVLTPGWNYLRFEDPGRLDVPLSAGQGRGAPGTGHGPKRGDVVSAPTTLELVSIEQRREHKIRQIGAPPPPVHSIAVGGPGDIGNAWRTSRKLPVNATPTTIQNRVHLFEYFPAPGEYAYLLHYRVPRLSLSASEDLASLRKGSTIRFDLDAGALHAGEPYQLIGSTLEPLGGAMHDGVWYPLRPDAYTAATLADNVPGMLRGFHGTLDEHGRASAQLVLPPGFKALAPGTKVYHALLVGDRPSTQASDPLELLLLP